MTEKTSKQIDPQSLMDDIDNGPSLGRAVAIALVVHAVFILATSVPYLTKVAAYGTWNVSGAMQQERIAEEEKARAERLAERQKARAAKPKTSTAESKTPKKGATTRDTPPTPRDSKPREVSNERPSDSGLNVDEDFGLQ
jgi:cytochrome c-type biogenesis protein CcmH/NrfG